MTIPSFIMVIYGATGDLTKRKLIPALFSLFSKKLLPEEFVIMAFARRPFTDESFVQTLMPFVSLDMPNGDEAWFKFAKHIKYVQGDFAEHAAFDHLREVVRKTENEMGECLSKLYYMAVAPETLPEIIDHIGGVGLHIGCGEDGKWTRVIFEKPFGEDLKSAQKLDEQIKRYFQEEQIYRIDHYLGKETVQNILSVRFANILLKPVWNKEYIERIEITAAETLGVESRGGYYDKTGALRDFVQNHLLQLAALTLMDEPGEYDAQCIHNEKIKIFNALQPTSKMKRGQYRGYKQEEKVAADSQTETYVDLNVVVDLPQWTGVPIHMRTGKKLKERETNIKIVFKKAKAQVFSNLFCELRSNELTIRIQPNEGMFLKMLIKEPGMGMRLQDVFMDYAYSETYDSLPDAYERLLLDAMMGDQALFTRSDEIEAMWRFTEEVMRVWEEHHVPLLDYEVGSWGPRE
jgi:glucose-6-phosphate 1-dehydrogenase